MTSPGPTLPVTPRDEDYPHTPGDREEDHFVVRGGNAWIAWAIVAFLFVVGIYFLWGFWSAKRAYVPDTPQYPGQSTPPPLK